VLEYAKRGEPFVTQKHELISGKIKEERGEISRKKFLLRKGEQKRENLIEKKKKAESRKKKTGRSAEESQRAGKGGGQFLRKRFSCRCAKAGFPEEKRGVKETN